MKNNIYEIKPKGYDEAFKYLIKRYFEPFAIVKTDYEILKLPKKVDIIIIEEKEPLAERLKLFKYFKRFNIIEFKSDTNRLRMPLDLYKLGIYINGVLMAEKEADVENTTFTLVTTHLPNKLIRQYKGARLRQGLYIISNIALIPIYVVAIEELELNFEGEIKIIKEFTSGKDRVEYLYEIIKKSIEGSKDYEEELTIAFGLYLEDINKIINKEKLEMTLVERNIGKWNEILGLKEKYIKEGIEKGVEKGLRQGVEKGLRQGVEKGLRQGVEKEKAQIARIALAKGLNLETISMLTGLTEKQLKEMKN